MRYNLPHSSGNKTLPTDVEDTAYPVVATVSICGRWARLPVCGDVCGDVVWCGDVALFRTGSRTGKRQNSDWNTGYPVNACSRVGSNTALILPLGTTCQGPQRFLRNDPTLALDQTCTQFKVVTTGHHSRPSWPQCCRITQADHDRCTAKWPIHA